MFSLLSPLSSLSRLPSIGVTKLKAQLSTDYKIWMRVISIFGGEYFLLLLSIVNLLLYRCICFQYSTLIDGTGDTSFGSVIGWEHSLSNTKTVSPENLRNILHGVEVGNKESIYFFGLLKLYGISVPIDAVVACESFRKAGNLGHALAATAHGTMLSNGIGVLHDHSAAVLAFRLGIQLGDKNAMWLLGKLLLEERSQDNMEERGLHARKTDLNEAFQLFKSAANEHIPFAEHHLATMYEYGIGVAQDFNLALHYYKHAAEQSHVESMYNLALMYAYGRGCTQDYRIAHPLLEGAASANHAPSCYYLGVFKMYGYGCEPDYEHAYNWFEKASVLNDFRISTKAGHAATELRQSITDANGKNERIIQLLQSRCEADIFERGHPVDSEQNLVESQ